jgi:hypothetical protein
MAGTVRHTSPLSGLKVRILPTQSEALKDGASCLLEVKKIERLKTASRISSNSYPSLHEGACGLRVIVVASFVKSVRERISAS